MYSQIDKNMFRDNNTLCCDNYSRSPSNRMTQYRHFHWCTFCYNSFLLRSRFLRQNRQVYMFVLNNLNLEHIHQALHNSFRPRHSCNLKNKRGQHNLSHRHSHCRSKLDQHYSLLLSHIPEHPGPEQPTTIHMSESTPHSLNDPSRFETWKLLSWLTQIISLALVSQNTNSFRLVQWRHNIIALWSHKISIMAVSLLQAWMVLNTLFGFSLAMQGTFKERST